MSDLYRLNCKLPEQGFPAQGIKDSHAADCWKRVDLRSVLAGLSDSELKQLGGETEWRCRARGLLFQHCNPEIFSPAETEGHPDCGWSLVVRLPEKEDT